MIASLLVAGLATFAAPAMNLSGGNDTPITPITTDDVDFTLGYVDLDEMCGYYDAILSGMLVADPTDPATMHDAADALSIWSFEQGWDETGSSRMTVEARDAMLDFLHTC